MKPAGVSVRSGGGSGVGGQIAPPPPPEAKEPTLVHSYELQASLVN